MSQPSASGASGSPHDRRRLSIVFTLIVLVEVAAISTLYWFGLHFGRP